MSLYHLTPELRLVIFNHLPVPARAATAQSCKKFKSEIDGLNDLEMNRIFIKIKKLALEVLITIEDPRLRNIVFRTRVANLLDFLQLCHPKTTNRPQYNVTKKLLELIASRILNPRHRLMTNVDSECQIPFQRHELLLNLNKMLPPKHRITSVQAKGLDLTPIESIHEGMLLEWVQCLSNREDSEELNNALIQGVRDLSIHCNTCIKNMPLVCIAAQFAKADLFHELILAGAYINDSVSRFSATPLVIAAMKYCSNMSVNYSEVDLGHLKIVTELLQNPQSDVNAFVKEGITLTSLLFSYTTRRETGNYFSEKPLTFGDGNL